MDQNTPVKPPPVWAGIRDRFTGKTQRILILCVGAVMFFVLFIVLGNFINKAGQKSTEQTDEKNKITVNTPPTNPFNEEEMNQLALLKLSEIVQFSGQLQDDINKFESEAKYYHQHFAELLKSTKTDELQKYNWVIDYFQKRWDTRLPPLRTPSDYRQNLEILLKTVKKGLQQEKGYFPKQEVRDAINYIKKKVSDGKLMYEKHNQLLDALLRSIGEGPQANPDTIQALVLKQEDEIITEEAKNTPWKDDKDNPMSFMQPVKTEFLRPETTSPDGGAIDELYREERQNRLKQ